MRKAMELAERSGAKRVVAFINEDNAISRKNYEREGFQVIARIKVQRALRKWGRANIPAWLQPYLLDEGVRPAA
jgi:ribosomal protein S18 acetylase RimI-like enzyme